MNLFDNKTSIYTLIPLPSLESNYEISDRTLKPVFELCVGLRGDAHKLDGRDVQIFNFRSRFMTRNARAYSAAPTLFMRMLEIRSEIS